MTSSLVFSLFLLIIGLVLGAIITVLIIGRENNQSGEESSRDNFLNYQELVHLWRDRENGNMLLEINGDIYGTADKLDEKNLSRMLIIAEKLDIFLNREKKEKKEAVHSAKPRQVENTAAQPAFMSEAQKPADEELKQKNLEMLKPPPKNEEPPRLALAGLQSIPVEIAVAESKALTMIEQIDALLQRLIPVSPIAGKSVRITEDPFKGVIVWVGMDKYEGIDEVPDKDIRIVIRAAVSEWEKHADSRRK